MLVHYPVPLGKQVILGLSSCFTLVDVTRGPSVE